MSIAPTAELATAAVFARWIAPRPSLVVMQPDTFCNMDCAAYCYLPQRKRRNRMPVAVAQAVAASLTSLGPDEFGQRQIVEVCWHGGEPLAVGVEAMTELLAPFEPLRAAGLIHHSVQTNATLINDDWCDLFQHYSFSVGVSIDGPADLNARRTDRAGRPAHDRIMGGIGRLRQRGIEFSVIAVVGTDGIGRAEDLLDFLAGLGATQIGFNIEEFEGSNAGDQPRPAEARGFWTAAIAWSTAHPGVRIRELDRLGGYLGTIRAGERAVWEAHSFDPLPTIAFNGDVILLSPELAGIRDEHYGDFVAGNVLEQDLGSIVARAWQLPYVTEFIDGLAACRATCGFFDFCRGATAGNRYFENGTFASTETNYCRVSRQELVNALIDTTRKEEP
ncbi:radical SAM protein [Catenulispora sp. NL8]|uniref:Radical SAM protein n=1 Tax=Catenulispora pinistramenti TaxID=2705254 RepID=A0ABS5KGH7_9ACTN|nr:cyclophane-forming radical SAM peptide maturase AmcB [Catenulispora pinistramenti]MBS2545319.1 radical SAM protein [Catenulispora pinistramenti]